MQTWRGGNRHMAQCPLSPMTLLPTTLRAEHLGSLTTILRPYLPGVGGTPPGWGSGWSTVRAPFNTSSGRDCVKSLRLCLHGTHPKNFPATTLRAEHLGSLTTTLRPYLLSLQRALATWFALLAGPPYPRETQLDNFLFLSNDSRLQVLSSVPKTC